MALIFSYRKLGRFVERSYRLFARQALRERMSMIITIDRADTARSIAARSVSASN
jgi:hypothetical protein